MRTRIPSVAGLTAALFLCTAGWAATPDDAEPAAGQRPVLEDALRVALQCELDGNDVDRNALLRHVLEQAPDHPAARSHLGYVGTGNRWVPYQELLNSTTVRRDRLSQYRDHRVGCNDTVGDHLLLANLARERELRDEERAHLMRIVELDWDNEEARQRLQCVQLSDGNWMTRADADAARELALAVEQSLDEWLPTTTRIAGLLRHQNGRARERGAAQLAALRDPRVIPAVEAALLDSGLEREYLDWLRDRESWEASVAMAGLAVDSDSTRIRVEAQTLLRDRPLDDFVPVLLGMLHADPAVEWKLEEPRFNWIVLIQTASYGKPEADYEFVNRIWYGPWYLYVRRVNSPKTAYHGDLPGKGMANPEKLLRALEDASERNEQFVRDATQEAIAVDFLNDRVGRCLHSVTGASAPKSPQDWFEWWNERNGIYTAGARPLRQVEYEEKWGVRRGQIVRFRELIFASCFMAGTPVVTEYGSRPIEDILLGDRVLAQDIETGQIAFKPVLKTTIRPPVGLLKVTTGDGELLCTAGHPFWINGLGWRVARELESGMRFHSVDGSCEIISVEDSGRSEKAYNLVVADYHDYFVGDGRILAHDNSPRNPTNALVPGLMPDWSATVPPGNQRQISISSEDIPCASAFRLSPG